MKRVLLKLSGESFALEDHGFGVDSSIIENIANEISSALNEDVQVAIVVGGGNFFRGVQESAKNMEQANADYMGMLATVMNALAMQNALEQLEVPVRVQSALTISAVCEPYIRRRATRHLEKGRVVIFAAGTGNPFFTTDTAAALRASEMNCEALLKGTRVDGVYSADPEKDKTAMRYDRLSYMQVLTEDLRVMDAAAVSLARENAIPILVFSIETPGEFQRVVKHQGRFTVVC